MRCWSRRTLRWMSFHRSVRQSSVRRLLSLILALLATPAQDLNSAGPSIFPHTGLTSACPRHYSGHLLLEPSLPSGHPAWPPAPIVGRAVDGLLRSVCPFSVTLGRHCTPRPSYRVDTTHPAILRGRVETFPCLGLPISRLAGSNSRRLRAFVEHPDHSHPLEASPPSASSLSPFTPCTPTFDSHSPAVG
jgi:hypothetical protein